VSQPQVDDLGDETHHRPASFWAVDLHVHTPASRDVQDQAEKYGADSPEQIVRAALGAGLDAIAVTDHNTVAWCQRVTEAAAGTDLLVLPGVEISTAEGHLLAIWEVGTAIEHIEDVLVDLGIPRVSQGRLDVAAEGGFAETARKVAAAGGLAIAAHADREKGLLKLAVRSHMKDALLDSALAAVEVAGEDGPEQVAAVVAGQRQMACVRGSDCMFPGESWHSLAGIGARRAWIKASRPDLLGLRHALEDPDLRVRLEKPPAPSHMIIKSVRVSAGFLAGQTFSFSPDLNCLLGGTGVGKSLLIEIIRFALASQPEAADFAHVRSEVDSRLDKALGANSTVEIVVERGGARYTVRRVYAGPSSPPPEVVSTDTAPTLDDGLIPIRAFSQGEVIEYARTPVGRMALIDAALDLTDLAEAESGIVDELSDNADEITSLRAEQKQIEQQLTAMPETLARLKELATFFSADIIKQQQRWSKEKARFGKLDDVAALPTAPSLTKPHAPKHTVENEANADLYQRVADTYKALHEAINGASMTVAAAYQATRDELAMVAREWKTRNQQFDLQLSQELAKIDNEGKGLPALKRRLEELQVTKTALDDAEARIRDHVTPDLQTALQAREGLLDQLIAVRRERRTQRRNRINELNRLMAGVVRIKLAQEAGDSGFLAELTALAKGSGSRADFLTPLSKKASPVQLVRSYLASDAEGAAKALELDPKHMEKLFDYIADRGLEREVLALQAIDLPDALTVEFRKSETDTYEVIERLAHGQKCTAILIIALADGDEPLIIDQPEDALHAPWIEEYLVDKLRQLRGSRQYIFASRSPGLVVSADAEMIITMTADATSGTIESSGSLERHNLNVLALYHLEGGSHPFKRRTMKLSPSVNKP